jgi:hypothetical protein
MPKQPGRVTLLNSIGAQVPRMARSQTAVTRIGTITSIAADGKTAVVNVGGKDTQCQLLKGLDWLAVGNQVLVLVDRDKWVVLGPPSGTQSSLDVTWGSNTAQSIASSATVWTPVNISTTFLTPFTTGYPCNRKGRYLMTGQATFNFTASAGSSRGVGIEVNDANRRASSVPYVANLYLTGVVAPHIRSCNIGDTISLKVLQASGAALTITPNSDYPAFLTVLYLGA